MDSKRQSRLCQKPDRQGGPVTKQISRRCTRMTRIRKRNPSSIRVIRVYLRLSFVRELPYLTVGLLTLTKKVSATKRNSATFFS